MSLVLLVVACIWAFNQRSRFETQPTPFLSNPAVAEVRVFDDPQWSWQMVDIAQLGPADFLFDGAELEFTSDRPSDVKIIATVDEDFCKYGQWYFGDSSCKRVHVLAEMDGDRISCLWIDSNRDRIIHDDELIATKTADGQTWIAELDVAVRTNGSVVYAKRQIGITPKKKADRVRITTLGYASGQIKLAGQPVEVLRIDRNGNGIATENQDQIWFELNGDGEFDPISERFNLENSIELRNVRYSVRSDRLGHSLKLVPDKKTGQIRFVFKPFQKRAKVLRLEGALRDETGMLIAIRRNSEPVTVPTGSYCVENLVVEVRDTEGAVWRMTLIRGKDVGWFSVQQNELHELNLLNSIYFEANAIHKRGVWTGHETQIAPKMLTSNGLVVTNFTCMRSGERQDSPGYDRNTVAKFKVRRTDENDNSDIVESCSGFN